MACAGSYARWGAQHAPHWLGLRGCSAVCSANCRVRFHRAGARRARASAAPCRALLGLAAPQEDGQWIQFDDDKMIPRKEEEVAGLSGAPPAGRAHLGCCAVLPGSSLSACDARATAAALQRPLCTGPPALPPRTHQSGCPLLLTLHRRRRRLAHGLHAAVPGAAGAQAGGGAGRGRQRVSSLRGERPAPGARSPAWRHSARLCCPAPWF